MTNRIWPADAVNGAPAYSGRALRQTQAPFLSGATAGRPLGARSGVRPGTSTGTVTATATTWTCRAHAGVLDVMTAAEAGPYTYAIDAAVSGAVDASNASNPRTDIVYAQLSDAAEEGTPGQSPAVTIAYRAGTAGPSAPVPATPVRSIILARINVPKTGGGNPTVTWVAPTSVAAGGILPAATLLELQAVAGHPGARAAVYADGNASLNGDYQWTGTAWAPASRILPIGAPLVGSNPPAGTRVIEAAGMVLVGTNGDGVGAITVPAGTFPNGVLNAHADRFDFSNYGPTVHVIHPRGPHSLTEVYIQIYDLEKKPVVNARDVPFSVTIKGW